MAEPKIETRSLPPQGLADPDVRKPEGVTRSASLADELWRATYQGTPAAPADPPDPVTPPSDNPDADAAGDPEPEPTDQREPSPTSDPVDEGQTPDPWEHRYNSMRGRYDQAAEMNRQLMQRIQALEHQQRISPPAPQQPPQPQSRQPLITPEERDEYGAEFLDVVRRQAREEYFPVVERLQGEIKQLRGLIGNTATHVAMNARQQMEADLDIQLPTWRDINMTQDFIDWLSLPEPYSGVIRHDLLRQAFEQNQTPRVAAFFQGFLNEVTALRPAEPRPAPETPLQNGGQPPQPRMDLGRLAAPGRGRAAGAPQGPTGGKPFISRDQIAGFYNDVRAGRYNGRPADKAEAEREIMEAQRDGRII